MGKIVRIILISGFVTTCVVIIVASLLQLQKNFSLQNTSIHLGNREATVPYSTQSQIVKPKIKYQNPFSEKASYTNPFKSYENPFENIN